MRRRFLFIISIALFVLLLLALPNGSVPQVSFLNEYAQVGTPLEVVTSGYPDRTRFTYQWEIGGQPIDNNTNMYTPTASDLEQFIQVTITPSCSDDSMILSTYFSRLPVLYLSVEEEIEHDVYTTGHLEMQGNSIYGDKEVLYNGSVEIRGRGNSTWTSYPKKPYRIKLDTAADLLGLGKNRHWVLLANYADATLMRNKLAYDLSGALGMPYMESTWVNVVLNGEYIGNYLLCEQIRIDKERIDITDLTGYSKQIANSMVQAHIFPKSQKATLKSSLEQDLSWLSSGIFTFEGHEYDLTPYIALPELTGGFLMEIDGYFDEPSKFMLHGQPLMFSSPKYACTNREIMNYAHNYFDAFFSALIDSEDFYAILDNKEVSYTELFDIDSLAQYLLIQEIFFNYDAVLKSNFLYKDVTGPAYMGPIWDMDWSSGRSRSGNNISLEQWCSVYYTETADETLWYSGLLRDPYFLSVLKELWDSSRHDIDALISDNGVITQACNYLSESGEANSMRWPVENNFHTASASLKNWLTARIEWLDMQFTSLDTLVTSVGAYIPDSSIQLHRKDDQISVTAPVGSTAVFYLNSIRHDAVPLHNHAASWQLPDMHTPEASDVIVVRIYDEHNQLVGSNYLDNRK